MRALSILGIVSTKHGSGTYITDSNQASCSQHGSAGAVDIHVVRRILE